MRESSYLRNLTVGFLAIFVIVALDVVIFKILVAHGVSRDNAILCVLALMPTGPLIVFMLAPMIDELVIIYFKSRGR